MSSKTLKKDFSVDLEPCTLEIMDRWSAFEETAMWPAHEQNYTDICNCDAIIFVYTTGSPESLTETINVHDVGITVRRRNRPSNDYDCVSMLVANKCDLQERETSLDQGMMVADMWGCDFLETSAKTGKNVEDVFSVVVRRLRLAKREKALAAELSWKRHRRSNDSCVIA